MKNRETREENWSVNVVILQKASTIVCMSWDEGGKRRFKKGKKKIRNEPYTGNWSKPKSNMKWKTESTSQPNLQTMENRKHTKGIHKVKIKSHQNFFSYFLLTF